MKEDSFYVFIIFMKASKISGLKEWAELVASQLTQITTNANKIKLQKMKMLVKTYEEGNVFT